MNKLTFDIANISVQKPVTPWAKEAVQIEYSKELAVMLHHISGVIRITPIIEKIARPRFHKNNGVSKHQAFRDCIT